MSELTLIDVIGDWSPAVRVAAGHVCAAGLLMDVRPPGTAGEYHGVVSGGLVMSGRSRQQGMQWLSRRAGHFSAYGAAASTSAGQIVQA